MALFYNLANNCTAGVGELWSTCQNTKEIDKGICGAENIEFLSSFVYVGLTPNR
jgi:hypothetical protein